MNDQLAMLIALNFKTDSRDAIQVKYDVVDCPHLEKLQFSLDNSIPEDQTIYYRSVRLNPYQVDHQFVGMIGRCFDCGKVYYKTC